MFLHLKVYKHILTHSHLIIKHTHTHHHRFGWQKEELLLRIKCGFMNLYLRSIALRNDYYVCSLSPTQSGIILSPSLSSSSSTSSGSGSRILRWVYLPSETRSKECFGQSGVEVAHTNLIKCRTKRRLREIVCECVCLVCAYMVLCLLHLNWC